MSEKGKRSQLLTHYLPYTFTTIAANTRNRGISSNAVNTLRPRQNGRHFADDIFKWILLNENVWIPSKISLNFVLQGTINNIPPLVQMIAWRRPGDKTLSGPMMVRLPTHICVTRPQWVNRIWHKSSSFTKINQKLVYLLNEFTYANMMSYIFINSSCVINAAYCYKLFLHKVNIYFVKYFLIDAQLADFLHYDVAKLN